MSKLESQKEVWRLYKSIENDIDRFLSDNCLLLTNDYNVDYDNLLLELNWVPNMWAPTQDQLIKLEEYGFKKLYILYNDCSTRRYGDLPNNQWIRR